MDVYRAALHAAREYLDACKLYGEQPTRENEARCDEAQTRVLEALANLEAARKKKEEITDV